MGRNDTKQAKWNKLLEATEGEASSLRLQEDERNNDDPHQGNAHQWERGQERHCNRDEHCIALKRQSDEHNISNESETSAIFTSDYELGNVKGTELFPLDTGKDITKPYYVYIRVDDVRLKMEADTGAAVSVISERLYN